MQGYSKPEDNVRFMLNCIIMKPEWGDVLANFLFVAEAHW